MERYLSMKHQTVAGALKMLSQSLSFAEDMIEEITVNVTEMFRDPEFFKQLQGLVFPVLAKHQAVSIWHAGCSTGEEVFSTAILLKEHGLLENTTLLGTDLNKGVVLKAQQALYASRQLNTHLDAYFLAGGRGNLLDYFTEENGTHHLKAEIKSSCAFVHSPILRTPEHKKFDLIMCRNTLIYFDLSMQDAVMKILHRNLNLGGFLCLGEKETLRFTALSFKFKEIDPINKIYQKVD